MTARRLAAFLAPGAALALAACTTVNMEDAFAQAAAQPRQEAVFSEPGDYPNLNVVPEPAAPQLTDDEKAATVEQLRARRQAQAALSQRDAARGNGAALRRLADSHAADALREIEGN